MVSVVSNGQVTDLEAPFSPFGTTGPMGADTFVEINPGSVVTIRDLKPDLAAVSPVAVWGSQPSVRKVVDYIARAVASTPLKVYRRVSDNDRQRVTDHPLARVLAKPSVGVTPYHFWHSVIVDWLLHDRFVVLKAKTLDTTKPIDLIRVQAARVGFKDDGLGRVRTVVVDGRKEFDPASCLLGFGYAPLGAGGTTPMQTLAAILTESREAVEYRRAVWKNGARVPGVLERPVAAPAWTDTARGRFREGWRQFVRQGGREGGTPILEDGMSYKSVDAYSPKDSKDIEGRQLSDVEVASAFHIAPELVGAREGTFSNIAAFRAALYRDALGPLFVAWEQYVNTMLTTDLDTTGDLYVQADVDAKLRGGFEEQAQYLQAAVGAPYMTRNEGRGRLNLPAVDGGDELITPLNVVEGGQASPQDSGSQNRKTAPGRQVRTKARAPQDREDEHLKVMRKFFRRQAAVVKSNLGAKAAGEWWDGDRWDSELSADLYGLAVTTSQQVATATLDGLGISPDEYDPDRTLAYLQKLADSNAANINAATKQRIDDALDAREEADDEDADPVGDVFDDADSNRAPKIAISTVTAASSFGTTEAARQVGGDKASKTWIVAGRNPRPSHSAMSGETVGIDDVFSNGLAWPGDSGDPDEVAGCTCEVEVSVE